MLTFDETEYFITNVNICDNKSSYKLVDTWHYISIFHKSHSKSIRDQLINEIRSALSRKTDNAISSTSSNTISTYYSEVVKSSTYPALVIGLKDASQPVSTTEMDIMRDIKYSNKI